MKEQPTPVTPARPDQGHFDVATFVKIVDRTNNRVLVQRRG